MARRVFALGSLILAGMIFAAEGWAQERDQDKCNLSKDLVVQALERVRNGTKDEAEDGLQLLKHATELCISNGDAWYNRSVFEKERGQPGNVKYALDKAKKLGSEAMDQGANPFHLATGGAEGTAPPAVGPLGEKWALVVGISKFQDKHLPRLNFASKDAKDFSALLLDPQVGRFKAANVHALTEGQTNAKELKMELNWLARSAQPNDLVVIFLSSHGTPRNRDTAEVNYIATSDTETEPEDNLYATALPMVEISDVVRTRIKAQRTVILLDTCHSGAAVGRTQAEAAGVAAQDAGASENVLDRIRQGVGRAIVTSSSKEEQSYEGKPYDNGYFTHFLLEAMRKDKGNDSIEQLYATVKQGVTKAASSIQRKQTPVFSKSEGGERIVIGASPGSNP